MSVTRIPEARSAGLDKFFHILVDWNQSLSPVAAQVLPGSGLTLCCWLPTRRNGQQQGVIDTLRSAQISGQSGCRVICSRLMDTTTLLIIILLIILLGGGGFFYRGRRRL